MTPLANKPIRLDAVPRALSCLWQGRRAASADQVVNQRGEKQHDEDHKQDLCNSRSGRGNAAEPEYGGNDGYDQKCEGPSKHRNLLVCTTNAGLSAPTAARSGSRPESARPRSITTCISSQTPRDWCSRRRAVRTPIQFGRA